MSKHIFDEFLIKLLATKYSTFYSDRIKAPVFTPHGGHMSETYVKVRICPNLPLANTFLWLNIMTITSY